MRSNFWANKRVLITGHSGFKGAWHSIILSGLGAKIFGVSLEPVSSPNLFDKIGEKHFEESICGFDIANIEKFIDLVDRIEPDIIFHFAAQPLVIESYKAPVRTINSNVNGTLAVLEAVRQVQEVRAAVIVTTDKCYENTGCTRGYRETDPLGGNDVYSASKSAAEIITHAYNMSFFRENELKNVGTVRAGNVIGGGDWANYRLIPDIFRAYQNQERLQIRNPNMVRPWQHVLEPLFGYLDVGYCLLNNKALAYPMAWNFGPSINDSLSVLDLVNEAAKCFPTKMDIEIRREANAFHEEEVLTLNCERALKDFGWSPYLELKFALTMTFEWYLQESNGADAFELCCQQINDYKAMVRVWS